MLQKYKSPVSKKLRPLARTLVCVATLVLTNHSANASDSTSIPVNLIPFSQSDAWTLEEAHVKELIRKVASHQTQQYGDLPGPGWTTGTFYSSFIDAYKVTGEEWYLRTVEKWVKHVDGKIKNPMHADELCPAQSYLDLHFVRRDDKTLEKLHQILSTAYFEREKIHPGELHEWDRETYPFDGKHLWSWADALYMAPPVLARMGKATDDSRYYDALHRLYWQAVENLYDADEQLLFRDSKEKTEHLRTPNGLKVFWGRGMGWVMAGLARTIDHLPENDPKTRRYIAFFQELSYSLLRYQQADGLWRSSLNDPAWHPTKEASASAFITFALAKGVNQEWLPRDYFLPAILKAWSGLSASVEPDGRVGYSQIVAGSPHEVRARDSVDYAAGALILAGSAILELGPSNTINSLTASRLRPRFVSAQARWPTETVEPVLKHQSVFYALHNTESETALTAFTTSQWPNVSAYARKQLTIQHSVSNTTSLLPISKDQLLVWAADVTEASNPEKMQKLQVDLPLWSEMRVTASEKLQHHRPSWLNVFRMPGSSEQLVQTYLERGVRPVMRTSTDGGIHWSEATPILDQEVGSRSDNKLLRVDRENGRIDFLLSIQSGENAGLYHWYFTENGISAHRDKTPSSSTYKTSELKIPLGNKHSGLRLNDAESIGDELILQVSIESGNSMKLSNLSLTDNGRLEEISNAILPIGSHAISGISLHPAKENTLVLSSRMHPITGSSLPNNRSQLFKASIADTGWAWQQLTSDPIADQIQPHIARGDVNAIFWLSQTNHTVKTPQNIKSLLLMSEEF